ncbi:hypothetical protein ACPA9J_23850 [Pseudomonas aeruginosa]
MRWSVIRTAASRLLQELQPPVQQEMSHCRIHYRQLVSADKPGLVLDIAPLSENDLAFYCLDVTRAGIMACWRHYYCARYLIVCCKSNWRTRGNGYQKWEFVKTG